MKNTILGACILVMLGFAYENVNDVVGKVIDRDEASYYRIFQDITGFGSARFFFSGESVVVEMNTGPDYSRETMYRAIGMKSFIALNMYIEHFWSVIEDPAFRREFARVYGVGWPICTDEETKRIAEEQMDEVRENSGLCVAFGTSAAANAGVWLSAEKIRESDECGPPTYKIRPEIYCGVTGLGLLCSSLLSNKLYQPHTAEVLLQRDIVGFDSAGMPILASEVQTNLHAINTCVGIGCGGGLSIMATASTLTGIFTVNFLMKAWDTQFECVAATVPMITLSMAELAILTKTFTRAVRKDIQRAAINKIIEQRRAQEKQREKQEEK